MSGINPIAIQKIINQASKQIPKGLSSACNDYLLKKTNQLLEKNNLLPNDSKEKLLIYHLVQDEQAKLVKKYLKKESKGEKTMEKGESHPWGQHGRALKNACTHNNTKVLKALLKAGLSPTRPTQDNRADLLLLCASDNLARTALSFYTVKDLKALIKKEKDKDNLSPHSPHRHFPQPWLITLAKQELVKKLLEQKVNQRTIEIEL